MSRFNFISIILLFVFIMLCSCNSRKNREVNTGEKVEIARVDHYSSGCFGSQQNKLTIYEQSNSTFARLETNGKLVRNVKISAQQIDSFNAFADKLNELKNSFGCTTVEDYVLYTRSGTIKRRDGGCDWNGFGYLSQELFGRMER